MCTPAPACVAALREATTIWPDRRRTSDGICSSATHRRQNSNSDHDTGNAFDLSHDPAHGVDCNVLAELVKTDRRVRYVIWNRRIYNPTITKEWRRYDGANPHDKHMHVSIHKSSRSDISAWWRGVPKEENELTPEEHDWLGRIHHEVVAEQASIRALIEKLAKDVAAIKKKQAASG